MIKKISKSYILVRLSKLELCEGKDILRNLYEIIDRVANVASIYELNDGSYEMVVLKSYLPIFQDKVGKMFPGCDVDTEYDPCEPRLDDLKHGRVDVAKAVNFISFCERAQNMIEFAWPTASTYYHYFLNRKMRE